MKHDITTNWSRSFHERHPVLSEWLGFAGVCALIVLVAVII
jgi:hypothetical protein